MYVPTVMRFTGTQTIPYQLPQCTPAVRSRSDHQRIFMPDGRAPRPAVAPIGLPLSEKNLFNCRSHKLGRDDLFFDSALEWAHGKRVEADPNVRLYCEHYPKAAVRFPCGKVVGTVFDMLILFVNGRFVLREIKYKSDRAPARGTAVWWQLEAQKALADIWQVDYKVVDETWICRNHLELDNFKRIVGMLTDNHYEDLQRRIMTVLSDVYDATIADMVRACPDATEDSAIRAICRLLFDGKVQAPLDQCKFNKTLPLRMVAHA